MGNSKKKSVVRHGLRYHPLYHIWQGMLDRCLNEKSAKYQDYGGRGIEVCDRWKESLLNFAADMGERFPGSSIDRIDNNGNYEPSNCRWATKKQQSSNKRNVPIIEHKGERLTIPQLASRYGIGYHTLKVRLDSGYSIDDALKKPVRYRILIDVNGIKKTASEWSKVFGIESSVIRYRLRQGWPAKDAVERPLMKGAKEI